MTTHDDSAITSHLQVPDTTEAGRERGDTRSSQLPLIESDPPPPNLSTSPSLRQRPSFWHQTKTLLYRNMLMKRHNPRQLIGELFFPLLFIIPLVWMNLQGKGTATRYPAVTQFPDIPIVAWPAGPTQQQALGNVIGYAPQGNADVDAVMQSVVQMVNLQRASVGSAAAAGGLGSPPANITTQSFATDYDLTAYYTQNPKALFAGIIFDQNSYTSYTLRFNSSVIPRSSNIPATNKVNCRDTSFFRFRECTPDNYLYSGFLGLQSTLNSAIMTHRLATSPTATSRNPVFLFPQAQQVPLPEEDIVVSSSSGIEQQNSIWLVVGLSFPLTYLITAIAEEKEKKIKEGMMMMGLRHSSFWAGWGITYAVISLVLTLVILIVSVAIKIFHYSNIFLIFLCMYFFTLSTVTLAFPVTAFFNKARIASLIGPFATLVPSLLYLPVRDANLSSPTYLPLALFFSPMGMSLIVDRTTTLEINGTGLQFSNLVSSGVIYPFIGIICAIFWYALLGWYLDQIVPSAYGVSKPWYFIFGGWKGRKSTGRVEDEIVVGNEGLKAENVEDLVGSAKIAVEINGLKKIFNEGKTKGPKKEKTAVDGVTMHLCEGEIFGLLGHNGAGKSTTIHMLCGLIPPTTGTAKIYGHDIRENMDEIRQMMGVCPQHDILYDDLSVREHLLIFACLKGMALPPVLSIFRPIAEMEGMDHPTYKRVKEIIREIDLEEKTEARSKDLSGGQKRKLSVGMAMVGDGVKVLVLDEPSSGMDPFSRRKLWDLLGRTKHDRITLLSTHFMDEADVLADRKAILSKGRVQCLGTSLFLKKRFGIGYWLDVVCEKGREREVKDVVGGLVDRVGGVLVAVAGEDDANVPVPVTNVAANQKAGVTSVAWGDGDVTTERWELPASSVDHFPELFTEMDGVVSEKKGGVQSYGLSMPTLEQVFLKSAQEEADAEMLREGADGEEGKDGEGKGNRHLPWLEHGTGLPTLKDEDFRPPTTAIHFRAMLRMRFLLHFRDVRALIFGIIFPIVLVLVSLLIAPRQSAGATTDTDNPSRPLSFPASPSLFYDPSSNATNAQGIISHISPAPRTVDGNFYNWIIANQPTTAGFKLDSLPNTTIPAAFGTFYTPTIYHNTSNVDALPDALTTLSNALFTTLDPQAPQILATLNPLPNTNKVNFDTRGFAAVLLLGIALALPAIGNAIACVGERESRVVGQLYVMGLKRSVYWASTFVCDWSLFFVLPVVMFIIISALKLAYFSGPALPAVVILLLLHLPNSLIFSYFLSLFFNRAETARTALAAPIQIYVLVPYLVVSLLNIFNPGSKTPIILHYVFATIMPYYAMTGGLYWVQWLGLVRSMIPAGVLPDLTVADYFKFDNHVSGTMLIMVGHMIVYSSGIIYVDFWKTRVVESMIKAWDSTLLADLTDRREKGVKGDDERDDDDVVAERRRVGEEVKALEGVELSGRGEDLEMSGTGFDEVLVGGVRKEFGSKVAVEWNSWGVRKGEVFALLGPNGAGKTTSLSIAIGAIAPTHGTVHIHSRNMFDPKSNAFQYMGYCPQFDGLWPTITVEEHLTLFATLKGLKPSATKERVKSLMRVLDIEEFKEKRSRDLSGGNRRKLSFAVAVVGEPKAIFLDEPSTGVDPGSRRWMWELIGELKKGRAVVLTTHSMEEADALSTRIAIQVSGRLRCIGTPQHLKTKFGSGYQLELASSIASQQHDNGDSVHTRILSLFPSATLLEHFGNMRRYRVPSEDVVTVGGLGGVFEGLRGLKGDGIGEVTDYAFSQTTLDQVFIEFAKRQEDEDAKGLLV
ncbi:ATP-binding cassette sub- A member 5 [Rhizophlyctis rosea]|nr:ATP-binding cassette sub- A member 5 [Rhizophlyctis rosea]